MVPEQTETLNLQSTFNAPKFEFKIGEPSRWMFDYITKGDVFKASAKEEDTAGYRWQIAVDPKHQCGPDGAIKVIHDEPLPANTAMLGASKRREFQF